MKGDRGFALVTVLWLALLLGLIAVSLARVARLAGEDVRLREQAVLADLKLISLRERGIWDIMKYRGAPVAPDGTIEANAVLHHVEGLGTIRVISADGLIDINSAAAAPFVSLAAQLGAVGEDVISSLDTARQNTAFLSTVGEKLIPDTLRMVTTVYSGKTAPDLSLAPPEVLALVPGVDSDIATATINARRSGGEAAPPGLALPNGWVPTAGEVLPRGPVYHVQAAATGPEGSAKGRSWIIFVPLPESRNVAPWFLLDQYDLPQNSLEVRALLQGEAQ